MSDFFFENDDVSDLAESHISRIRSLEDSEATRILKTYKRVRQELRDRLEQIPPGTFTAQKLQGTLFQVQLAIDEMNRNLLSDFGSSAQDSAEFGVEHLIKELEKWNSKFKGAAVPINLDAVRVATDTKNFLFNQYDVSIQAYGAMLRSRMAKGLTDAVVAQDNLSDVIVRVGKTFMGEEWKLLQIVRTELHNVYNQGKISGMMNLWDKGEGDIPDLKKTLFHPMDSRTGDDSKRLAQNNPIVPIDEPFVETSTGKRLEYMAPPNRPNDRAILIPYRDSWSSSARVLPIENR